MIVFANIFLVGFLSGIGLTCLILKPWRQIDKNYLKGYYDGYDIGIKYLANIGQSKKQVPEPCKELPAEPEDIEPIRICYTCVHNHTISNACDNCSKYDKWASCFTDKKFSSYRR